VVSPRLRVAALTAVAAVAAVTIAVVVAYAQRGPDGVVAVDRRDLPEGAPPIALDLGVRVDAEARDLRRAAQLYDDDKRREAARIFALHDSLEARVGQALAAWPDETLNRLEQLGGLYASSAVVQLHLGLARIWSGRRNAEAALRAAADLAPNTRYAITAGNILHTEFAPDLPVFVPSHPPPAELDDLGPGAQLALLQKLFRSGDRVGGLYYGVGLQRLGRPVTAARTYATLARRFPKDPDSQVATAVAQFDKDDPSRAFSRLGPLTRAFPKAATVRFHLGLMLLWRGTVKEAKRQLRLAEAADPGGPIARQATRYLDSLERVGA
jgi:tetratricopeptide (TPR) repeat protein